MGKPAALGGPGPNYSIGAQLRGILDTKFAQDGISTIVGQTKSAARDYVVRYNPQLAYSLTYELMISSFKSGPNRLPRFIHLQHSLLSTQSNWCLIVRDDSRESVQQRLNQLGENWGPMDMMSLSELTAKSPESRGDLAIYDKILVDGRIYRTVRILLGPGMIVSGAAVAVDLEANDLVEAIKCAFRGVHYASAGANMCQRIEVGAEWMRNEAIAENIIDFVARTDEIHFGGIANVHQIIFRPKAMASDMQHTYEIDGAALLLDQPDPDTIWTMSWWKKRPLIMCTGIIVIGLLVLGLICAIYFGLQTLF